MQIYQRLIIIAMLVTVGFAPLAQPAAFAGEGAAPTQGDPNPRQAVEPAQGTPGTVFTFFSYGFGERTDVAFWAIAPNGEVDSNNLYRTYTTGEGRADWQWAAPGDAMPGTWQMVAQQVDRADRTVVILLEVVPLTTDDPPPPQAVDSPAATARNVQPAVGEPGTKFSFFATGFKRKELVGYWFNMPNGQVDSNDYTYRARASEDGRVDWSWVSPVTAVPGVWQVVVRGAESGLERSLFFEIRTPEQVAAAPGGQVDQAVSPQVGGPRTTFAFFALGFASKETVTYWVIDPDGDEIGRDNYRVTATDEGRADWYWRPPVADDATPGTWQMVAYGTDSNVTRIIPFEITWE